MSLLPATSHVNPTTTFWEQNTTNGMLSVPFTPTNVTSLASGSSINFTNTPSLPASLVATDVILHKVSISATVTATTPNGNLVFMLTTGNTNGKTSVALSTNTTTISFDILALGFAGSPGTAFIGVQNLTNTSVSISSFSITNSQVVKIGSSV